MPKEVSFFPRRLVFLRQGADTNVCQLSLSMWRTTAAAQWKGDPLLRSWIISNGHTLLLQSGMRPVTDDHIHLILLAARRAWNIAEKAQIDGSASRELRKGLHQGANTLDRLLKEIGKPAF